MQLLIDTHALIWYARQDKNLPPTIRNIIEYSNNTVHVSVASFYEIAIKLNIGKLELGQPLNKFYSDVTNNGLQNFPSGKTTFPNWYSFHRCGHRGPFVRLLIATALAEEMTVLTAEPLFQLYGNSLQVIW